MKKFTLVFLCLCCMLPCFATRYTGTLDLKTGQLVLDPPNSRWHRIKNWWYYAGGADEEWRDPKLIQYTGLPVNMDGYGPEATRFEFKDNKVYLVD